MRLWQHSALIDRCTRWFQAGLFQLVGGSASNQPSTVVIVHEKYLFIRAYENQYFVFFSVWSVTIL
jgi:hypothetical protein